jgi:hypothetical protein
MFFSRKARDFKLLMNLLAEQSGLAHSFRILAVFDKHFQRLWRARDMKMIIQRTSTNDLATSQAAKEKKEKDGKEGKDDKEKEKDKPDFVPSNSPASLWVLWNDADIAQYANQKVPRSFFEYTVEIR